MAGFLQVIEMNTADIDGIKSVEDQWYAATEGKRTLQRSIVAKDRNTPNRYFVFAFFESADSAAENSKLPETDRFAGQIAELMDGPPTFTDLDVIHER